MLTTLLFFNCELLFSLILICWLGLRCPHLTRRDIFFAVTVSPSFPESPEAVAAYARYRRSMWIHTGVALLILILGNVMFLLSEHQTKAFLLVGSSLLSTGWQIGGMLFAFLRARRIVLPHSVSPSPIREVSLAEEPVKKRSIAFWFFWLGPWVILGLAVFYLQSNWDRIPERFPIHWGIDGQADHWADRSFLSVYGMLILGAITILFMEVIMFLIAIGIPRRGTAARGSRSGELHWMMQATRWFMLGLEYCLAMLFALLGGYIPVYAQAGKMPLFIWLVIGGNLLVTFVGVIFFVVWMMRKKAKIRKAEELAMTDGSSTEAPRGDWTEDKYWKCGGIFYYNPDDPAIWVTQRIGFGWTTNMARPAAWAIMGAFLVLMLLFSLVTLWIGASM